MVPVVVALVPALVVTDGIIFVGVDVCVEIVVSVLILSSFNELTVAIVDEIFPGCSVVLALVAAIVF